MSPRARRPALKPTDSPAHPAGESKLAARPPAASPQSRFERIAQRAYAIYERRGGSDGSSVDDWLQAEREIDSEV